MLSNPRSRWPCTRYTTSFLGLDIKNFAIFEFGSYAVLLVKYASSPHVEGESGNAPNNRSSLMFPNHAEIILCPHTQVDHRCRLAMCTLANTTVSYTLMYHAKRIVWSGR